ncbi:hypothetical protein M885DRAFT_504526 [Pelagophyceae sp. CCMP2097]|nr:hypothetical protein M885DRAFT_504526 [Pelagophyceae sp. CCMP2097]
MAPDAAKGRRPSEQALKKPPRRASLPLGPSAVDLAALSATFDARRAKTAQGKRARAGAAAGVSAARQVALGAGRFPRAAADRAVLQPSPPPLPAQLESPAAIPREAAARARKVIPLPAPLRHHSAYVPTVGKSLLPIARAAAHGENGSPTDGAAAAGDVFYRDEASVTDSLAEAGTGSITDSVAEHHDLYDSSVDAWGFGRAKAPLAAPTAPPGWPAHWPVLGHSGHACHAGEGDWPDWWDEAQRREPRAAAPRAVRSLSVEADSDGAPQREPPQVCGAADDGSGAGSGADDGSGAEDRHINDAVSNLFDGHAAAATDAAPNPHALEFLDDEIRSVITEADAATMAKPLNGPGFLAGEVRELRKVLARVAQRHLRRTPGDSAWQRQDDTAAAGALRRIGAFLAGLPPAAVSQAKVDAGLLEMLSAFLVNDAFQSGELFVARKAAVEAAHLVCRSDTADVLSDAALKALCVLLRDLSATSDLLLDAREGGNGETLAHGLGVLEHAVRYGKDWREKLGPLAFRDVVDVCRAALGHADRRDVAEAALYLLHAVTGSSDVGDLATLVAPGETLVDAVYDAIDAHDDAFVRHAGKSLLANLALASTPTFEALCGDLFQAQKSAAEQPPNEAAPWDLLTAAPRDVALAAMRLCEAAVRGEKLQLSQVAAFPAYYKDDRVGGFLQWAATNEDFLAADRDCNGVSLDDLVSIVNDFQATLRAADFQESPSFQESPRSPAPAPAAAGTDDDAANEATPRSDLDASARPPLDAASLRSDDAPLEEDARPPLDAAERARLRALARPPAGASLAAPSTPRSPRLQRRMDDAHSIFKICDAARTGSLSRQEVSAQRGDERLHDFLTWLDGTFPADEDGEARDLGFDEVVEAIADYERAHQDEPSSSGDGRPPSGDGLAQPSLDVFGRPSLDGLEPPPGPAFAELNLTGSMRRVKVV